MDFRTDEHQREDTSVGSGAAAAIEKWDFLRRSTSCSFVVAFFSGCSSSATKTITSSGAIKHKYTRKTREGSRRHPLCETASDASEPHRIGTRKKRRVIVDVLSCRSCQNTVSEVLRSVNRRGLVEQQWLFSYRADTHTHHTSAPVPTNKHKHTLTFARWREHIRTSHPYVVA